jgi:hypothetical protein
MARRRGGKDSIGMLAVLRRIMTYEMTIAEWIGLALILGVPYLLVGLVWALTHAAHLTGSSGVDTVVSVLATIASWPVLLVSNVCMQ